MYYNSDFWAPLTNLISHIHIQIYTAVEDTTSQHK